VTIICDYLIDDEMSLVMGPDSHMLRKLLQSNDLLCMCSSVFYFEHR